MIHPFIIGVAGGSGSGKTYFAKMLAKHIGHDNCLVIQQDSYYHDQSHLFDHDGGSVNFDHPDALDFQLLGDHLHDLKQGNAVDIPIYDFATHQRQKVHHFQEPKQVIIVDGILILSQPHVREFFDESVFVQTPEALRFERRLSRDVVERGRTHEGVHMQFEKQVKPMHDQFVEPSKEHATIISNGENIHSCLETLKVLEEKIKTKI